MSTPPSDTSDIEPPTPDEIRVLEYTTEPGPIATVFTPGSRLQVFEAFLQDGGFRVTVADISETTGLHHDTVYEQVDALLDHGLIVEAGKQGNAKTYLLNVHHGAVQKMYEVRDMFVHGRTTGYTDARYQRPSVGEVIETVLQEAADPLATEAIVAALQDRGFTWASVETLAPILEDAGRVRRDPDTGHWRIDD